MKYKVTSPIKYDGSILKVGETTDLEDLSKDQIIGLVNSGCIERDLPKIDPEEEAKKELEKLREHATKLEISKASELGKDVLISLIAGAEAKELGEIREKATKLGIKRTAQTGKVKLLKKIAEVEAAENTE